MEKPVKTRSMLSRMRAIRQGESGAEAVEFALVAPLLFFLVFGLLYLLLLFAAQLSLGYATNVAVRYAAIPVDALGTSYPGPSDINTKVDQATPFFSTSSCTPSLAASGVNQPVTLTMDCDFPNPAGRAADALRQAFFGGGDPISGSVELSATARSRKE